MSSAQEVLIANAVVGSLNDPARPWAGKLTAVRTWLPVYTPDDLVALKVSVVPITIAEERLTREKLQAVYAVAIDFQQTVKPGDLVVPDLICSLAEQVNDYFGKLQDALAGLSGWFVVGVKREDVYSLSVLYTEHTFETLVVVSVKGAR